MIVLVPLAVIVVLFAAACLASARSFVKTHGLHWILYRAGTGHHLDGHRRNNRGWLAWGTRPGRDAPHHRHSRWSRRPRLHRALAFWVAALGIPYAAYGLRTVPGTTVASLRAAAGLVLAYAGFRAARWMAHRGHRRHAINPVATALAGHIGVSMPVMAENLRIRQHPEKAKPGEPIVRIRRLPDTYAASESDREWVQNLLASRIPVDMRFEWQTHRHPMQMVAKCKSSPPADVALAGHAAYIDTLGYGQYLLGVSASGREVWDANEEDPHLMNCARTRRGKTNTNLAIACQGLRRGERVSCVDPKRISLLCLRGVPGFTLANDPRDPAGMWKVIREFRTEMDVAIDGNPVTDAQGRPVPHTLILEEANQLFALFREHWETIKEPGQRVTDVPAWRDVKAVLHQGAQFGYRVVIDGQDLTQQVMFGMRSAFGTILATGYTPAQYRYVTGQTAGIPPSPTRRGRFMLIRGTDGGLVQVVCADPKRGKEHNELAWRAFALGGRQVAGEPGVWAYRAEKAAARARLALPMRRPVPPELSPVLMGPVQAAAYLGLTPDQFKMARRRYPIRGEFKHVVRGRQTACWAKETLDLWAATRVAGPRHPPLSDTDADGLAGETGDLTRAGRR